MTQVIVTEQIFKITVLNEQFVDVIVSSGGGGSTTLTGDVTGTGSGTIATTLATVNSNVGTFTNANITVNAKGLITAAASGGGGGGSPVVSDVFTATAAQTSFTTSG